MRDEFGEYVAGPGRQKNYFRPVNLHLSPDSCSIQSHWWREAQTIANRTRHGRERKIKLRKLRTYRQFACDIRELLEQRLNDHWLAHYFENWLRLKGFLPKLMQFKRIRIKIIIGKSTQRHEFVAPGGQFYTQEQMDINRGSVINWLDEKFPKLEFKEVQVGPNAFNYIATGVRPAVKS